MGNISLILKQLCSSDFSNQDKGKSFEYFCKRYLEKDPVYSCLLSKVYLWKEWPDRWGPDHGIDLIAEAKDGKIWAIQCKAYNESRAISKRDIDKFLSESARIVIDYRLIISTTENLHGSARRVIDGQEKPVGFIGPNILHTSTVNYFIDLDVIATNRHQRNTPRAHQMEAIEAVEKGLTNYDRGQLIMACGTGKTSVSQWISERLGCKRVLVLVPSLSLLSQTIQSWCNNTAHSFRFLPVCSDESVINSDSIVSQLFELGFPSTTDSVEVAKFLSNSGNSVIFSTYQSSRVISEAISQYSDKLFDLIIFDEAHRCSGNVSSYFGTALDNLLIPAKKRLFMTATPRIYEENHRAISLKYGTKLHSMDDISQFGPVLHSLTFGEAIQRDILCDYQVVIVGTDNSQYAEYIKERTLVTTNLHSITDAASLAIQIAIGKATIKYDLRRIITFHSRVKAAKEFSSNYSTTIKWLSKVLKISGNVWAGYIEGKMTAGKRRLYIERLREIKNDGYGLLSNARCLSEGIDLPSLDGVAFVDPRRSQVDIVQAVGRAIRKVPNKKLGTIILPVLLPESGIDNADLELDCSPFTHIWAVLKALRSHDNALAEEIDCLRKQLGRTGHFDGRGLEKIIIDLPVHLDHSFANSLKVEIIKRTSMNWYEYMGLLDRFVSEYGHSNVPSDFAYGEYKLGSWVSVQRKKYKKRLLSASEIKDLEGMPSWSWDKFVSNWEFAYNELLRHVKQHGSCSIPNSYSKNEIDLRNWCSVQRKAYKKGDLNEERIKRLEALPGWFWNLSDTRDIKGQNALKLFIKREQHARVPSTHIENDFKLGLWLLQKKELYQTGCLPKEEIVFFESLPKWSWKKGHDQNWELAFSILQKYVQMTGNAQPPSDYILDEFRLATWVKGQREAYNEGRLSQVKAKKLSKLPGWSWKVLDDRNEQGFEALGSFVKREGHALVSSSWIENGFKLGQWVVLKRQAYQNPNSSHKISKEDCQRLEAHPFWFWNGDDGRWERGKYFLLKFIAREGHSRVKTTHIEQEFELGKWVGMWRYQYKNKKISQQKIDSFESQPQWSWDIKADIWTETFQIFKEYAEREGHTSVPVHHVENGVRLGVWIRTQQYAYAKQTYGKRLSHEKITLLESVPGWQWKNC